MNPFRVGQEALKVAVPLSHPYESVQDLDPLIERLSQSQIVMLGEATHGTHEFYQWRRLISEQLIKKYGFSFIAVEGDWPPCEKVNQWIRSKSMTLDKEEDGKEALRSFHRWPTWMWSNTEVLKLIDGLRSLNSIVSKDRQVGFHGLDVYSFFESMNAVIETLEEINPFLARRVRRKYACFDSFHQNEKKYLKSLFKLPQGCERQVAEVLEELLQIRLNWMEKDEQVLFDVRQNARIVKNAEHYYRTMVHGSEDAWNVRDRHMMETLDLLRKYYGPKSRGIVWEHNTHIGDYRATDMVKYNHVNIGGLARDQYGKEAVALVGFGTFSGTVIASHSWDGPVQKLKLPQGRVGSYEALFHSIAEILKKNQFYMCFDQSSRQGPLSEIRGHRAVGVVYDPEHERYGNYVPTSISNRYDAFVFIDKSRALEPLPFGFNRVEIPESWPGGQ